MSRAFTLLTLVSLVVLAVPVPSALAKSPLADNDLDRTTAAGQGEEPAVELVPQLPDARPPQARDDAVPEPARVSPRHREMIPQLWNFHQVNQFNEIFQRR